MDDLFARDRGFWLRMGRAVVIGTLAGAAALTFTQIVRYGTDLVWPENTDYGWLGGEWWWVVLLGVAGLIVGVMRLLLPVDEISGSLTIIQESSVDRSTALPAIAISIVSMIGGASLGPFDGGVRAGASVGDWYSSLRGLSDTEREVSSASGINGALGGLLTAPVLASLLATELRWPVRRNLYRILLPSLTAAIFGFAVSFAIIGDTFLGVFALPGFELEFWHLGLGVILGVVAASLSWALGMTVYTIRRWILPAVGNQVIRATVGGVMLGLIAVAFPLTLASGKAQLGVAIDNVEVLGAGLLMAVVVAKIVAIAISLTTGFIGGPVMPALFIGGTAGLAIHALFPGIPIALAFSAMLVAVPGVSIGAPFSMILLAVLTVGIGAVETVPAAIAVLTGYTLTAGMGWFGLPVDGAVVDIDDIMVQSELFELGADPLEDTD
ncbi:MAG: chloride channel protein [Actinomycetia bacterium]|nr:chloride channel protein [Actinomycetes bacterium]